MRDPNGSWTGKDAGFYFYDWNDAGAWNGDNIFLLQHAYSSLEDDNRRLFVAPRSWLLEALSHGSAKSRARVGH